MLSKISHHKELQDLALKDNSIIPTKNVYMATTMLALFTAGFKSHKMGRFPMA
jgi:hypothetical protein